MLSSIHTAQQPPTAWERRIDRKRFDKKFGDADDVVACVLDRRQLRQ